MRNIKRSLLIVSVVLGAGVLAVAVAPVDPLVTAAKQLQAETDQVLRRPFSDKGRFESDSSTSLATAPYQKLIASFKKVQAQIEAGSRDRQNENLGQLKLTGVATAAKIYLDLEKRLYFNALRNIHTGLAQFSELESIERLSLKLASSTALTLYTNDVQYHARFNLWHLQGSDGGYAQVKYGISQQELSLLEQEALTEAPSRDHYAKLIQMLTVRERMTNQWALHRMLGQSEDNAQYYACGKDLVSFKAGATQNYYQTLWNQDRYDEFLSVKEELVKPTLNQPVMSADQLTAAFKEFFNSYASFRSKFALTGNADLDESSRYFTEEFYAKGPATGIANLEKKYAQTEASAKASNAVKILLLSNFVSDAWDHEFVADRISWASYEYRVKLLVDLMVNQARDANSALKIDEVVADPQAARAVAEKIVRKSLESKAAAYRKNMGHEIIAQWQKQESLKSISDRREKRMAETVESVLPALTRAARADSVLAEVSAVLEKNRSEWNRSGKLSFGGKDHELAYLNARHLIAKPLALYTPDQLSVFFNQKLSFWKEQGLINKMEDPQVRDISRVAQAISENPVVLQGMKKFFGQLAEHYYSEIKSKNLAVSEINESTSPLAQIVMSSARESFVSFQKEISAGASPQPAAQTKVFAKPNFEAAQDHTAVKTRIVTPIAERSLRVAPGERELTLKLFVSALSLINLGEVASQWSVLVQDQETLAKIPHSPLEIEHLLNRDRAPLNASLKLSQSLLDQKLVASILKNEMLSEYPLLNLRMSADIESPRLGDRAVEFYQNGALNLAGMQNLIHRSIQKAGESAEGLVEEACSAKAGDVNDAAFANLYRASGNLRAQLKNHDARYKILDEQLALDLRSPAEKVKDWMDPVCTGLFWITLIAMTIYFGPVVWTGLASAIAAGNLGAFTIGATGALETMGATSGGLNFFASLLMGKASMAINSIFIAQLLVWTNVNCFQLPAYLKYEMRVAASQVGVFSQMQISNAELENFNQEVSAQKISTYVMIGFQALMVPGMAKSAINTVKKVTGLETTRALKAMANVGSDDPLVSQVVEHIREKGMTDLVKEHGAVEGTTRFVKQRLSALSQMGRVNTLGSKASNASIRYLLASNLTAALKEDPQALVVALDRMLAHQNALGGKIQAEAERSALLSVVGKVVKNAEMDGAEGFVKGREIIGKKIGLGSKLKTWIQNQAAVHGLKNTKYWRIAVSNDALKAVAEGAPLPAMQAQSEMRALILFAMLKDIRVERDYYAGQKAILELYLKSGELSPEQALAQHFKTLGDQDWAYYEKLLNFAIKKADKPLAARINLSLSSQTQGLAQIKESFRNYHVVRGELDQMREQIYSQFSPGYFSEEAESAMPEFEVDDTGYTEVMPLQLKAAPHGFTEVFFDTAPAFAP